MRIEPFASQSLRLSRLKCFSLFIPPLCSKVTFKISTQIEDQTRKQHVHRAPWDSAHWKANHKPVHSLASSALLIERKALLCDSCLDARLQHFPVHIYQFWIVFFAGQENTSSAFAAESSQWLQGTASRLGICPSAWDFQNPLFPMFFCTRSYSMCFSIQKCN